MTGEELRSALKETGLPMGDIAEKLGITRQAMNLHFKKDIVDSKFLLRVEKIVGKKLDANALHKLDTGSKPIPIYDVSATAGGLENISQMQELPSYYISMPGYEDCNFGLNVYGHSMYPTIENGTLVVCRRINDKSIIMYGEIYVLRTADYLMVKRLQKNNSPRAVMCISDNPEMRNEQYRRYEPFELAIDKIMDLYLVKGIFKKTQS